MKHSHYIKPCPYNTVDIYRICQLFEVNDPSGAKQHAIKKIIMAGKRGVKSEYSDIQEAIDTLSRWQDMRVEEINIK